MVNRLLITGGSGLIGSRFIELAHKDFNIISVNYENLPIDIKNLVKNYPLDITKREEVIRVVEEIAPDRILHLAAITDVEGCEINKKIRDLSWKVNVEGTRNLVEALAKINDKATFYYVSTDFVFNGKNGPYSEEALPDPVTEYGKTKLAGEKIVTESGLRYCIIRTSYPYRAEFEAKKDIVRWMIFSLEKGEEINLVTDQYITPTFIDDFVKAISVLIRNNTQGIYHVAGPERLNFYQMGLQIAEVFGFDKSLLKKITLSELTKLLGRKAHQPSEGGLKIDKLLSGFGGEIEEMDFKRSLEEIKRQRSKM